MRMLVLAIRFMLELCALAALAVGGWSLTPGPARIAFAVVAPAVAAVVWGRFIAPASRHRLADPARFVLELVVWLAATAALAVAGLPALALAFAVLSIGIAVLVRVPGWQEPAPPGR